MKKNTCLATFVLLAIISVFANAAFGESLYQAVEDKIEYTLRKDSKRWFVSDYKYNTVTILDAHYIEDNKIGVKGTFIYELPIGPGQITFDATLKKILDDVNVVKMSWVQPTGAIWCIGDCGYQH